MRSERGWFIVWTPIVASCLLLAVAAEAGAADLTIDAPPSLAGAADRIRSVGLSRLEADLRRAGLRLPQRIEVLLLPDDDPRARAIPPWIVGLAAGVQNIVILPQRVLPYPYDSIESVLRHEVTHLALSAAAGGRRLPRWFHEGVAMSVDAGWDLSGQMRLLFEMTKEPGTADLARLFAADTRPETALAYGLSAALVADVERRHGAASVGRIAARVEMGEPFARAFEIETGASPDTAAAQAWGVYRRWTAWLPAFTSGTALWAAILALAAVAYAARRRRRARRRRQWDEEDSSIPQSHETP
jgi:hypothetical protein